MNGHNDTIQGQVEDTTPEKVVDPWQELQSGFKGIHFLENPKRLKEIRDLAHELKADFNKQVVTLGNQQKQLSDELDQLTAKQEIDELKDRITTIDKYLGDIQKRVKKLIGANKASAER